MYQDDNIASMELLKEYVDVKKADLPNISKDLLDNMPHRMVLLRGELGAGKTTLVKAIIDSLGSKDSGSSPSYSIINQYILSQGVCYHMDLYRLNTAAEAFDLGLEEILYGTDMCFIEWPDLIMEWMETPYHVVELEVTDVGRHIKLFSQS